MATVTDPAKPIALDAYEALAERYAQMAPDKAENGYIEHPAMRAQLGDVRGMHVLDAGCGPGILAAYLLAHGARVTAFDVSPRMLELARGRAGEAARIFLADLSQPLAALHAEEFDLVASSLALGYVHDWSVPLGEFHRVLKRGRRLVFTVQHPLSAYLAYRPRSAFDVQYIEAVWSGFGGEPVMVPDFYRPLEAIIQPLLEARFRLTALRETRPIPALKEKDPYRYEYYNAVPTFLCIEAVAEA